jgi:hypothetical protein
VKEIFGREAYRIVILRKVSVSYALSDAGVCSSEVSKLKVLKVEVPEGFCFGCGN